MTYPHEDVTISSEELDRFVKQAEQIKSLRTLLEMVIEERDTWRWNVMGGDYPKCRHLQLHDSTETVREKQI